MLPQGNLPTMVSRLSLGAGEGIRTLDPDLGKVVLNPSGNIVEITNVPEAG
jgi:hypothetical protein